MPRTQERLRIARHADGSCQVVECGRDERAQTVEARDIRVKVCITCQQFIGNLPYHVVRGALHGDQWFHRECAQW